MHLYIHIPFCDGKCDYCGFYSVPYASAEAVQFLAALEREVDILWPQGGPLLKSIYIGGGTPSVLSCAELASLTGMLRSRCRVAADIEWTVEGSPNTLTAEKLDLLEESGVNRISVGIQTFDDEVLAAMKRRHNAEQARGVLKMLAGRKGLAAGCDLIAGLPGQSGAGWKRDIEEVCDAGLKHVSVYAFSLEEGTPCCRRHREGLLNAPDEDEVIDRLEYCAERLGKNGLERYEVSNYAVQGFECRHNLGYWRGADYAGTGPGASSRLGLMRRTNKADLGGYIKSCAADNLVPCEEEHVSFEEDVAERLIYNFRLKAGVDFDGFCREHGVDGDLKKHFLDRLEYLCGEGLIRKEAGRYMPSARGLDFADAVAEGLVL